MWLMILVYQNPTPSAFHGSRNPVSFPKHQNLPFLPTWEETVLFLKRRTKRDPSTTGPFFLLAADAAFSDMLDDWGQTMPSCQIKVFS